MTLDFGLFKSSIKVIYTANVQPVQLHYWNYYTILYYEIRLLDFTYTVHCTLAMHYITSSSDYAQHDQSEESE